MAQVDIVRLEFGGVEVIDGNDLCDEAFDFAQLFSEYPDVRRVAFNGGKAELLWRRYIAPGPDVPHSSLATGALPSSSGSPGQHVLPFEEKAVRWKQFLGP